MLISDLAFRRISRTALVVLLSITVPLALWGLLAFAHDRLIVGGDIACLRAQLGESEAESTDPRNRFELSAVEAAAAACHFAFKANPHDVETFFLREKTGEVRRIASIANARVRDGALFTRGWLSKKQSDFELGYRDQLLLCLVPLLLTGVLFFVRWSTRRLR